MKRLIIILLLTIVTSACSRAASSPLPTEPALDFPTTSPNAQPRCSASNLEASSNSNGANGAIILGVTLTNISQTPCTLSNPPQASLLNASSEPLDLQTVEVSPEQTPPAPALMQLAPGESAIMTLIWSNICKAPPDDGINLRLELSKDQNLDVKMKINAKPRCDAENEASTITVAPYSIPP
jgi:hypothetical protein